MNAATATTALLVALAAVALAPAASATITVDVEGPADCETNRYGTGPAFRDSVYTEDCDVHAEYNSLAVECRITSIDAGVVHNHGTCNLHVTA